MLKKIQSLTITQSTIALTITQSTIAHQTNKAEFL